MHDVIVKINSSGPGFTLWMFPDTTPLHVWRTEHKASAEVLPNFAAQGYAHPHKFAPGESFRLNWQASQLVTTDKKTSEAVRYDQVCLVQQQITAADPIMRVFRGWVSPELISRQPIKNDLVTVEIVTVPVEVTPELPTTEVAQPVVTDTNVN